MLSEQTNSLCVRMCCLEASEELNKLELVYELNLHAGSRQVHSVCNVLSIVASGVINWT